MLDVELLSVAHRGIEVLRQVSLSLEESKLLAVLGPSGSGKTTLLRAIMGFEVPTAGSVSWRGLSHSSPGSIHVPPEGRGFGMVFQDVGLFPHLTVIQNVAFGLTTGSRLERLERARQWLSRFQVDELAERDVQTLSGGERQRVALARALAPAPKLLLLDEPFSNVDRLERAALLKTMRQVLEETGTSTVFVTHDARDVFDFQCGFILLRQGTVIQKGAIHQALEEAPSDWARQFLAHGLGEGV